MICVFDSSALLAWLRNEPGADVVDAALHDPAMNRFVHALNLAEVYYDQRRALGEQLAQNRLDTLYLLGVTAREDLDAAFWQDAARIMADYGKVSLADCCGLALTRRVGGTFLTSDRHEMDRDEILALCPIQFIR